MAVITITRQPLPAVVPAFDIVNLETRAGVDNFTRLRFQWFRNGVEVNNRPYINDGFGTLSISGVTPAQTGNYYCRISSGSDFVVTNTVSVTIGPALPVFDLQPSAVVAAIGSPATFACAAHAPEGGDVEYQWIKHVDIRSEVIVEGATDATLTIDPVTADAAGLYACFVRCAGVPYGATSDYVTLTVPTSTGSTGGGGTGTGTGGSTGGDTGTGKGGGAGSGPTFTVSPDVASMAGWQGIARSAAGPGRWKRNGSFSTPRPTGPPVPELPFEEFGDRKTMIWKQRWRVALENWSAAPAYTTHPDRPEMYLIKETAFEVRGAGVLEWERWYCGVPQNHKEEEVFPFSYQYVASSSSLATFTRSVTSKILCEYFLERDEAAYPAREKDEFYVLPTTALNASAQGGGVTLFKSGDQDLHLNGTSAFFISDSQDIVAEPSKITVWNHPIKCRATRYVPAPTMATLGRIILRPTNPTGSNS